MERALGIIEIQGLATAIMVADTMVKTADICLMNIEPAKGGGWMTVKIKGNVAAVHASINAGKQVGETHGKYISSKVIPRPAFEVSELFCKEVTPDKNAVYPEVAPEPAQAFEQAAETILELPSTEPVAETVKEAKEEPPSEPKAKEEAKEEPSSEPKAKAKSSTASKGSQTQGGSVASEKTPPQKQKKDSKTVQQSNKTR